MRITHSLPLAAAILLAACGGDADTDGSGDVSADEVAAEASGMVQPRPGQYRASPLRRRTLCLLRCLFSGLHQSIRNRLCGLLPPLQPQGGAENRPRRHGIPILYCVLTVAVADRRRDSEVGFALVRLLKGWVLLRKLKGFPRQTKITRAYQ